MFFSGEQRELSQAFDDLVEATDEVLKDPEVVAALGDLALELSDMNDDAFLPNYRHGEFVEPRSERGSSNLAIVPVTDEQAPDAYDLVEPLQRYVARTWPMPKEYYSQEYGIDVTREIADLRNPDVQNGVPEGSANDPARNGLSENTLAHTAALFNFRDDKNLIVASRPHAIVRRSILEADDRHVGAVMAHEEVHALDIQRDGIMYATLPHMSASELRAYHVSDVILTASPADTGLKERAREIEEIRLADPTPGKRSFEPTPDIIRQLRAKGVV